MLKKLLTERKCFKLVCGAGNEDAVEVEKLVALYASVGARYFDLSARPDVVLAAQRGLRRVVAPDSIGDFFLNVSVGIKGDPHVSKARIDQELCIRCGRCREICPQRAIMAGQEFSVFTPRCIGCGACVRGCPVAALVTYSQVKPLEEVLPPLIDIGVDSIELHAVGEDEGEVDEQWGKISALFDGMLSICTDRSCLGDAQLLSRIGRMIAGRGDYTTIIQADGAPMSGCDDRAATTLQALATAQIVQRAELPVFLMLSGGTNSRTAELASLFAIQAHGVALGSYARMIVREQIDRDDFFENPEQFGQARAIARELVEKSLGAMG